MAIRPPFDKTGLACLISVLKLLPGLVQHVVQRLVTEYAAQDDCSLNRCCSAGYS